MAGVKAIDLVLAFAWLLRNVLATDTLVVCTDPSLISAMTSIAISGPLS